MGTKANQTVQPTGVSRLPQGPSKHQGRLAPVADLCVGERSDHEDRMVEGPFKYGGIAALMVFGVGLLLVGKIWPGLGVLGFGGLVMAVTFLPSTTGKVLSVAVGALIASGVFAYLAASNEVTGTATYQSGIRGSLVTVTRQASPAKFREVTNLRWGISGFCLLASVVGFVLCRKFEEYSGDYA
jgi:hypothetical protein